MEINLTIKNYRCFGDAKPARIQIGPGFTAFVGMNNAGKTALLRFFFEFRSLFQHLSTPAHLPNTLAAPQSFDWSPNILDSRDPFANFNERDLEFQIDIGDQGLSNKKESLPFLTALKVTVPRSGNVFQVTPCNLSAYVEGSGTSMGGSLLIQDGQHIADCELLCQAVGALSKTFYIPAFRNVVNAGANTDYFDMSIGEAFVSHWRNQKTGHRKDSIEAIARLTDDIARILGFDRLEINASEDNQTLQLLINGKSFRLDEVGAGVAQFVLTLVNVALKQPEYILIDEPELCLHPSLQLDFLTTLASYAGQGILFATHSYGLARAAGDRVYTVRRSDDESSEVHLIESTPYLSELLGSLSYGGYQDLGFEKVLLVEGPHDLRTIQQFLRRFGKEHQIVLLPLGGSSTINANCESQLAEVKRICPSVAAIIDSERSAADVEIGKDRLAFVAVCEKLVIDCCVTDRRAMENYLTDAAVKKVKGEKYRALEPYEKRSELPIAWSKSENWRIAREMSENDLKETDVGRFLAQL